jgi:hypothetical protein
VSELATAMSQPPAVGDRLLWVARDRSRTTYLPVQLVEVLEVPCGCRVGTVWASYKVRQVAAGTLHTALGHTLLWPGSLKKWLGENT